MSYEENVAEIENLVLEQDMKFDLETRTNYQVDIAVATLATHGRLVSLFDIMAVEELDAYSDIDQIRVLSKIHTSWWDSATVAASDRNLLAEPASDSGWQGRYKHAMALLLIEQGVGVALNESYYGWQDYGIKTSDAGNPIIAVLAVREESWDEFAGTFVDADSKTGITGEVVFKNGENRKLRVEGSFSEIVRELASK